MSKDGGRLRRVGVLAPVALSACVDASVLAAPAAGAILSTVLKELSKAFMLKKWFHGVMTAQDAENLLMQKGKNGSYLVRESQTHQGEYVLSVRVRGRVSHVMIRKAHNKYDVGIGESFDDLTDLIEHCRAYPLTENSGDIIRLTQPVSGSRSRSYFFRRPSLVEDTEVMSRFDEDDARGFRANAIPEPNLSANDWSQVVGNGFYGQFVNGSLNAEYMFLRKVEKYTRFTNFAGTLEENRIKNRYQNVVPYDQNRVILAHGLADVSSNGYINASYIKPVHLLDDVILGVMRTASETQIRHDRSLRASARSASDRADERPTTSCSRSNEAIPDASQNDTNESSQNIVPSELPNKFYIATQGCLWPTTQDFWQMIIENDVRVIAMLGRRVEEGERKCEKYWPPNGEKRSYGNMTVQMIRESSYDYFIIREFKVSTSSKTIIVYQYQFKEWPDRGVPIDTEAILEFIREVNGRMLQIGKGKNPPRKNIMCVHCSAGVGRTGTFIALDMLIDQVKIRGERSHIDIYNMVKLCRMQRPGMVQNIMQYKFIYLAMRDYLDAASRFTTMPRPLTVNIGAFDNVSQLDQPYEAGSGF